MAEQAGDLRLKARVTLRRESGETIEADWYKCLIDTTTQFSKQRELSEGDKSWYFAADGNVYETDKWATDGSVVCNATGQRLWPVTPAG